MPPISQVRRLATTLLPVALIVVAPFVVGQSPSAMSQLDYILCLILICIGLNVATGIAGQLTLGPGATFGLGAYTAAVFASKHPSDASLLVLCVIGVVAAAIFGLVVGLPALRVGGFYLAVITLFIALALPELVSALSLTGGTQGISLIANPDFLPGLSGMPLYEVLAVIVLAVVAITALMQTSKLGRRLLALRTSEELLETLGYTAYRSKLLAFLLSSLPCGLAGALYVYSQGLVTPGSIDPNLSIYLVAACVIGGFSTIWGPVVGAVLVFGIQLNTGSLVQYQGVIYGALLIGFARFLPGGLVGLGRDLLRRRRPRTTGGSRSDHHLVAAPDARPAPVLPPVPARGTLRVDDVVCAFSGVVAVNEVSLQARPGQVHALIGSNGSGKTTLLNAICGYVPLQRGSTSLGDVRLDKLSPSRISRNGIARTFQTPKLVAGLSVLDNVRIATERDGRDSSLESLLRLPRGRSADRHGRELALSCLAALGLDDLADSPVALVPHGPRRLIEVARCMATPAAFVLLDEPAAGLSATERAGLADGIRWLAARGSGVILIEHDTSFVFDLADSITVLHQGNVIASGTSEEVRAHPEVARAYLGETAASDAAALKGEGA